MCRDTGGPRGLILEQIVLPMTYKSPDLPDFENGRGVDVHCCALGFRLAAYPNDRKLARRMFQELRGMYDKANSTVAKTKFAQRGRKQEIYTST